MKSILLHVYDDTALDSRLQAALDLARACDGHITCVHATPYEDYLAADPFVVAALSPGFSKKMERRRLELQARIEAKIGSDGLAWDWVHVDSPIADALIRFSALADLVVVSQASPAIYRDEPRAVVAPVATAAKTPVLVVPATATRLDVAAPAVVAWNGSPEASVALRWALPLLRLSEGVHVLIVKDRLEEYPSDAAARYLSRHGIEPEIVQRPVGEGVGSAITAAAQEFGAGLIVMGAYGHSRMREFILGGTTRDMLERCAVPLLVAH